MLYIGRPLTDWTCEIGAFPVPSTRPRSYKHKKRWRSKHSEIGIGKGAEIGALAKAPKITVLLQQKRRYCCLITCGWNVSSTCRNRSIRGKKIIYRKFKSIDKTAFHNDIALSTLTTVPSAIQTMTVLADQYNVVWQNLSRSMHHYRRVVSPIVHSRNVQDTMCTGKEYHQWSKVWLLRWNRTVREWKQATVLFAKRTAAAKEVPCLSANNNMQDLATSLSNFFCAKIDTIREALRTQSTLTSTTITDQHPTPLVADYTSNLNAMSK